MTQQRVPFLLMRGGTSRGPYFKSSDLPQDRDQLAKLLLAVVGGGHPNCIDGIGGGSPVTAKVAMLATSEVADVDVEYFFAQVGVERAAVDFAPTCGNILVGVGPAAIEMGLIPATPDKTRVRIRAVNTDAMVIAEVETPNSQVNYQGSTKISGVPNTAAPISLQFIGVEGSKTGAIFPTGSRQEKIEGLAVTCMDVAMPMLIVRAIDVGLTCRETKEQLDSSAALFDRLESIRLVAGKRMGLGDVSDSVIPKVGIIAEPAAGGSFSARYFMPWSTHPSLAVTGSQCLAACVLAPGTVGDGIAAGIGESPCRVVIEHPQGRMTLTVRYSVKGNMFEFQSAEIVRTARLIARGELMVPPSVFAG